MSPQSYDTLIIGAGFGGIYQLQSLLHLHTQHTHTQNKPLSVHLLDEAPSPGGTWYWNKYPGAMSDTESYIYRYSWDKADLLTYPWPRHYLKQPDVLAYLEHIVRKHDLRRYMRFNLRLKGAVWDGGDGVWRATVVGVRRGVDARGEEVEVEAEKELITARYIVTALGLLSKKYFPDMKGMEGFGGKICHTAAWKGDIELRDKRVGVVGTGSTGVQVVTEIAKSVKSLTVFQRRAQYSVPSGDGPVDPEHRARLNKNYEAIMAQLQDSALAFGFAESTVRYESVPEPEREKIFEALWAQGNGFRFMFGGFCDIATSHVANEAACNFIRKKIGQIVKDPEKARLLKPTDRYARRPLCDGGYYEQFNRDNVHIVDVAKNPLSHFTEKALVTTDGKEHELDVVIFATGFDGVEGSYTKLHIRGVGGKTLNEHWTQNGPTSYLGVSVANFPNLFLVTGPQGPFCNVPPILETHVRFITYLIGQAESSRRAAAKVGRGGAAGCVIEAAAESEKEWVETCERTAAGSLFKETASWIFGRNIAGKREALRFYFGGLRNYNLVLKEVIEGELKGFKPLLQEGRGNKMGARL
ncbi:hypothetical protein AJ79_06554 [Helicocarpus griseus UAMH5409]|uniref:Uncharacterized protein n=1 Tax=Helicocarpus griseus UAMH5409 TaxID=1447875 RepID=A0A2B7XC18_9EURO|nr:hypothetical protein AJ79_06554 [Helicocarpus griseus UAMH5409]